MDLHHWRANFSIKGESMFTQLLCEPEWHNTVLLNLSHFACQEKTTNKFNNQMQKLTELLTVCAIKFTLYI